MQQQKLSYYKNTTNSLSTQVKLILAMKGYSHIFNKTDFQYHKRNTKGTFWQAGAIANDMMLENSQNSDYAIYHV